MFWVFIFQLEIYLILKKCIYVYSFFLIRDVNSVFIFFYLELVNQREVVAWIYYYSNKIYLWNDFREFCQKYYIDLVVIQNKNEIIYFNDVLFRYSFYYWIGIRKINNNWIWVGIKKTFIKEVENWVDNEFNNKGNNQDCVEIYIKSLRVFGKWNDEFCWKRKRVLCYIGRVFFILRFFCLKNIFFGWLI